MKEYLFIGGHRDGERLHVNGLIPVIRIPKPRPAAFMDNTQIAVSLEHESYRKSKLACGDEKWSVYLLTSVPDREVIPRLIAGYRKP